MTKKEKELFEKKVSINDKIVLKMLDRLNLLKTFNGTVVCMDFHTPRVVRLSQTYFPNAKVVYMEHKDFEYLFMIQGLYYKNEEERIDMLKSIKENLVIIANPPYGKIGANITKKIIDTVDYVEYVNLLPANDYKRNDTKDLFNYQSDMEAINDGFADAAVTTHLARIHKTKVNDLTLDEFERSNYIDRSLDKYFAENSKRKHYAMTKYDNVRWHAKDLSNRTTFILGWRLIVNKRIAKSDATAMYKWNVEKSLDGNQLVETYGKTLHGVKNGEVCYDSFTFDTEIENINFTNFMYSNIGKSFMTKVWTAMSVDGGTWKEKWMPKVDWTRSWTVEEILANYGYSQDEIQEVMDDLVNYKGMED